MQRSVGVPVREWLLAELTVGTLFKICQDRADAVDVNRPLHKHAPFVAKIWVNECNGDVSPTTQWFYCSVTLNSFHQ